MLKPVQAVNQPGGQSHEMAAEYNVGNTFSHFLNTTLNNDLVLLKSENGHPLIKFWYN